MITYTDDEIEQERQDTLENLAYEHGESLEKIRERYQSEYGFHEVLHISHIFMENVDSYLLGHAAVILDKEAHHLAHTAHTALFNLYQRLGELRFNHDKPEEVTEEEKPKQRPHWWNLIKAHLMAANLKVEMKASIERTLDFFADAEEEDEDVAVPNPGSFTVMLRFLEDHGELAAPSLGIDRDGMFSVIWHDQNHRWSLRFRPWDIDHSSTNIDPEAPSLCATQKNILVTEVIRDKGVESVEMALDNIVVPEWLR